MEDDQPFDDAETEEEYLELFQQIVLILSQNVSWLKEVEHASGYVLHAKKNVNKILNKNAKTGVMSQYNRKILRVPERYRNAEQKMNICLTILQLDCFQKFPPIVRAELIPHLLFYVIITDRMVMRKGDRPLFVYFILSGEVRVVPNANEKHKISGLKKAPALYGAGECIGDIEILENMRRTHTYEANVQTELLAVVINDFRHFLLPYMQKEWDDKKRSLRRLGYFDYLKKQQFIDACKALILKEYKDMETIYVEDLGAASYVHFVLQGECTILQCLRMRTYYQGDKKIYELLEAKKARPKRQAISEETKKNMRIGVRKEIIFNQSLDPDDDDTKLIQQKERRERLGVLERYCELIRRKDEKRENNLDTVISTHSSLESAKLFKVQTYEPASLPGSPMLSFPSLTRTPHGSLASRNSTDSLSSQFMPKHRKYSRVFSTRSSSSSNSSSSNSSSANSYTSNSYSANSSSSNSSSSNSSSSTSSSANEPVREYEYESHFMEVATISFGGIFGLGENMDERVVVSKSEMQCGLMPRYWLFEEAHNPRLTWQKKRRALNKLTPSREQIFQRFLQINKWKPFKEELVQGYLDPNCVSNATKPEDIPIFMHFDD